MQNSDEQNVANPSEGRIYELGYLFLPTIPEEEIAASYGDLKEILYSLGGNTITDEMPKMLDLAYTMQKVIANSRQRFDKAYFGWIKFEINPESLDELKSKLDVNESLLRYLIVKTVRENTIATKRFASKAVLHRKSLDKKEEAEEPVEINKEEIDKEIDALVAQDE